MIINTNKQIPMIQLWIFLSIFNVFLTGTSCNLETHSGDIVLGAARYEKYLPLLKDKNVGMLVNHTSMVGEQHLLDFVLAKGVKVTMIFTPEHGFRGTADAGEKVSSSIDPKTGIPISSLYGKTRKPTDEMMAGLDAVIFDIQDVGVRFYTYISSMHYMMEKCAELDIAMIVFDRPNPNGYYVDGPIRDEEFKSFVGMHPIPVVHGLTVGELAKMINGERWLSGGKPCNLTVVAMSNYDHNRRYSLPVKPSPNLPNDRSINLYPSICLFEGTKMSLGRGTYFPFQVLGYPDPAFGEFTFTPESIDGMSKEPKLKDQKCYGIDLRQGEEMTSFSLEYLIKYYNLATKKDEFFIDFFDKLAGSDQLRQQISSGLSEADIRKSWEKDLKAYRKMRSKYLLYPDFE
jgi:uncharacterized protein YbbC (DUF1343 family)